ncbi:L-Aspartase-like protein [Crepidotus variabilis]|uniref:L-Aspartase-like protein n=1 Tax=Crepidotus variabilis TaxID=179855 RepID=A0A9P6JPB5_9AGAR|nr:L-Aspartase-like protein [Crepidotus variabilis]
MTAVSDSVIFRDIFSTPEASSIWSDRTRTHKLALVQGRRGIIPQNASAAIQAKCNVDLMDLEALGEETRKIGYPMLPVVKELVRMVNEDEPGLGEWAHWGATTQDVTDTATVLQLKETCRLVENSLNQIIEILQTLSVRYANTPMAARSNLQQAVPMTFGFKMARLLSAFKRHKQRLSEILPRLFVLQFSGAAGTLATLAETGLALEVHDELAEELHLKPADIAWHTERDRIAEIGAFFAILTGEVSEPYAPHRDSSSTMPQKRNPISCVYITAMAATIKQLSAALFDALVEDHERGTGPWEIEWIVLPQISTLTHATLVHTVLLLDGLEIHEDAMKKNLDLTKGTIVSEAVMMELGRFLGRQVAHDLVYDVCQKVARDGTEKKLLDYLLEDETIGECGVSRDRLQSICEPRNYVGLSKEYVWRVTKFDTL